jgi:hypothetical protein
MKKCGIFTILRVLLLFYIVFNKEKSYPRFKVSKRSRNRKKKRDTHHILKIYSLKKRTNFLNDKKFFTL